MAMFAIAAPLSYAFGLASWRIIERPSLRMKRRLPRAAAPQVAAAEAPS